MRAASAPLSAAELRQLSFEGARTGEQPSIELGEIVVRAKEHESARHTNGNADRAAVELDCETLAWH
jgi:hypothetical protein